MLTTAIIAKERKFPPKIRDEREILRKLIETLRELESDGSRRGESRTMPRFGKILPPRALSELRSEE